MIWSDRMGRSLKSRCDQCRDFLGKSVRVFASQCTLYIHNVYKCFIDFLLHTISLFLRTWFGLWVSSPEWVTLYSKVFGYFCCLLFNSTFRIVNSENSIKKQNKTKQTNKKKKQKQMERTNWTCTDAINWIITRKSTEQDFVTQC